MRTLEHAWAEESLKLRGRRKEIIMVMKSEGNSMGGELYKPPNSNYKFNKFYFLIVQISYTFKNDLSQLYIPHLRWSPSARQRI